MTIRKGKILVLRDDSLLKSSVNKQPEALTIKDFDIGNLKNEAFLVILYQQDRDARNYKIISTQI